MSQTFYYFIKSRLNVDLFIISTILRDNFESIALTD
jgi:hypothetical protein